MVNYSAGIQIAIERERRSLSTRAVQVWTTCTAAPFVFWNERSIGIKPSTELSCMQSIRNHTTIECSPLAL